MVERPSSSMDTAGAEAPEPGGSVRIPNSIRRGVLAWTLLSAFPAALAADPGNSASAEPTMAELLERIEELERSLEQVRAESEKTAATCASRDEAAAGAKPAGAAASASDDATEQGTARGTAPAPIPASDEAAEPAGTGRPVLVVDTQGDSRAGRMTAGYKDGFYLASRDGTYKLRLRGQVQADSRFFVDHGGGDDEFTIRRARLDFRGTVAERYKFQLMPDFTEDGVSIEDALVDIDFAPWAELRVGKFKTPFGIERLQSSSDQPFVERSLVDNLVPNRDIGLRLGGKLHREAYEYQLAVMNGVPDNGSSNGDVNDSVDVVGRVFAQPFVNRQYSILRGAGAGFAATYGKEQGDEDDDQLGNYRTSGRREFFEWENSGDGTIADGGHWRISPQAKWYEGPVGVLGEYVLSSQQVSYDDTRAWVDNQAWQIRTHAMLTGEDATMKGVEPDRPFNFGEGDWGAWEVALRWASLDVDPEVFRKDFADPDESARSADALGAAVNWYLNRNVTVYFHYEHTMFGGGGEDSDGDRDDEDVFLTRLQLVF
jgi:phosphate-selective porin OprO/OprP